MSRSNPVNNTPNPSTRWFEWSGSEGKVKYYDKTAKQNRILEKEFVFILLDQTATVKGWHDASESAIYANEVRDTRDEPFVVKAFKGGILAEGFYSKIKDRVAAVGGHYVANLYIAYKDDADELAIGSLQFKGSALGAWMEWSKAHREDLYKQAIEIVGYDEGKKGKVTFRTPKFFTKTISDETNDAAVELDKELQGYLKAYFARTRIEQVEVAPSEESFPPDEGPLPTTFDEDREIPF